MFSTGVIRPPFFFFWKARRASWFLSCWSYNTVSDVFGVNQKYFCYSWDTLQWGFFHVDLKGWEILNLQQMAFLQRLQVKSALRTWQSSYGKLIFFLIYSNLISFSPFHEGCCSPLLSCTQSNLSSCNCLWRVGWFQEGKMQQSALLWAL